MRISIWIWFVSCLVCQEFSLFLIVRLFVFYPNFRRPVCLTVKLKLTDFNRLICQQLFSNILTNHTLTAPSSSSTSVDPVYLMLRAAVEARRSNAPTNLVGKTLTQHYGWLMFNELIVKSIFFKKCCFFNKCTYYALYIRNSVWLF